MVLAVRESRAKLYLVRMLLIFLLKTFFAEVEP